MLAAGLGLILPAKAKSGESVLILGAGAAGLAAADALERRGIATCVIEARRRVGGRVWTVAGGVDLGASWIHGVKGNPVTALAHSSGVRTVPFDYDDILCFSQQGRLSEEASGRADGLFERLLKSVARAQESAGGSMPLSKVVRSSRERVGSEDHNLFDYAVRTGITHEYAADPEDLSLEWFDSAGEYSGGDAVFPEGYAGIFRALRPPQRLLLGETVRRIEWAAHRVRVTTDNGEHEARAVIVTLPLGVLKSGSVRFLPELPPSKSLAIARLGVGTLNKVVMEFPTIFWPRETALFGRVSDGSGEWEEWVNLTPVNGRPALVGFHAGRCAVRLEALSDEALVRSGMGALREMFGRQIPSPAQVHVTRWASDPFARGSYSHFAPGSSPEDCIQLAATVDQTLFFAGEACSATHPATVHGALESGRRAGWEIASVL